MFQLSGKFVFVGQRLHAADEVATFKVAKLTSNDRKHTERSIALISLPSQPDFFNHPLCFNRRPGEDDEKMRRFRENRRDQVRLPLRPYRNAFGRYPNLRSALFQRFREAMGEAKVAAVARRVRHEDSRGGRSSCETRR
jgi:hypothetical protein